MPVRVKSKWANKFIRCPAPYTIRASWSKIVKDMVAPRNLWRSTLPKETMIAGLKTRFPEKKTAIYVLDGNRMTDHLGLFITFQKELKFPDYFGHNTDAFFECITDMDWLDFDCCFVVIEHSESILKDHLEDIAWFLDLCQEASKEWAKPIALGECWDRPAKPFAFIFLFKDEKKANEEAFKNLPILDGKGIHSWTKCLADK
jgi:RNAse (barnase) inhibitor barstar